MSASEPSFWLVVGADLRRYGMELSASAIIRNYMLNPGFRYTFLMRAAAFLARAGVVLRPFHLLVRVMLSRCGVRFGISIPYNTCVGPGLYIGHYGGIVVNDRAVIGRDCNINHGVTIGVKYGGRNPGVPVLGDRVYLGPGCKVIGGVSLGNDVAVGANAVVFDPISDFGVAVGIPAKIASFKGSSEYVSNTGSASRLLG